MTLYKAHPSPWFNILVPTGLGVMLKSTYIIASVPATLNLSLVTFLVLALLGEFCFVPSQLGFAKIKLTKNAFCFYVSIMGNNSVVPFFFTYCLVQIGI